MIVRPKAINFGCLGLELFSPLLCPPGLNWWSSFASDFQLCCWADQGSPSVSQHIASFESSSLLPLRIKTWFICYNTNRTTY